MEYLGFVGNLQIMVISKGHRNKWKIMNILTQEWLSRFNPIAPRMAKTPLSFGHPECSGVSIKYIYKNT